MTQGSTLSFHYPPESMGGAISSLFLNGPAQEGNFHKKMCIFLYILLDCGHSNIKDSMG